MALSKKRIGRITGSSIGAILGYSPFATREDVLRTMVRNYHGAEREFKGNAATEWGTFHEEYAIADLEIKTGHTLPANDNFYIHPHYEWLGTTPDVVTMDFVCEIKCPYFKRNDENPIFKTAKEQMHYYAQMQYEMFCTKTKQCLFYQWTPKDSVLEYVEFDQGFINDTLPELLEFHQLFLSEIDNPVHLEDLIVEVSDEVAEQEYKDAKAAYESSKVWLDKVKAQLVEIANGRKTKIGSLLVYETAKKGAVSYSKVVKDHCPGVDLEPYRGKESRYWSVK